MDDVEGSGVPPVPDAFGVALPPPDAPPVCGVVVADVLVPVPVSIVGLVDVAAVDVPVPVSTGGVVVASGGRGGACTITLNVVEVAAFPAASVALHVTVVVPTVNVEPDGGVHDAVPGASVLSDVAGAVYETIAPEASDACALTSSWRAIEGGVVSGGGIGMLQVVPSHVPCNLSHALWSTESAYEAIGAVWPKTITTDKQHASARKMTVL